MQAQTCRECIGVSSSSVVVGSLQAVRRLTAYGILTCELSEKLGVASKDEELRTGKGDKYRHDQLDYFRLF
jgi:hypothetical protein